MYLSGVLSIVFDDDDVEVEPQYTILILWCATLTASRFGFPPKGVLGGIESDVRSDDDTQ